MLILEVYPGLKTRPSISNYDNIHNIVDYFSKKIIYIHSYDLEIQNYLIKKKNNENSRDHMIDLW